MKKEWSSKWVSSNQPRKQRKYAYNAPLHARRKLLSVHLSENLRQRYGKRSMPVRKGDEVLILRGDAYGTRGVVERVDLGMLKVFIDGVKSKKSDGSEVMRPIRPSNLIITRLSLDDKRRQAVMERASKTEEISEKKAAPKAKEPAAKPEKKPAKKQVKKKENKK